MSEGSLAPGQTGAAPNQRERKNPAPAAAAEDEAELESKVADLDRRTLEHLRGTATRLPDAAVSRLVALRPPARLGVPVISETSEDDQELQLKVNILKSKIKTNVADLPKVLDKINDSVARYEKVDRLYITNKGIH